MRGHIRRRGEHSFEYIVDIGTATAQRCQVCNGASGSSASPGSRVRSAAAHFLRPRSAAARSRAASPRARSARPPSPRCWPPWRRRPSRRRPRSRSRRSCLPSGCPPSRAVCARQPTQATRCSPASTSSRAWAACSCRNSRPAAINALYAHLSEHGRVHGGGPLSASSVRRVHAVLHRACHDAVRWGRLSVNPVAGADPPRASAEHHDRLPVWTAEQLSAFLDSVADDRLYALWRVLAMSGMRRGEALGLAWDDVAMEAGSVTIRRAWIPVDGVAQFSEPKSKRSRRTIALDPVTLEALRTHAARQADEQRTWQEGAAEAGLVFTRPDGHPLVPWAVSKAFREHAKAAMLPHDPAPWPAPHLRHPGAGQWCQPPHRLGQARPCHRGPHPGCLLARPAAGRSRGGREDRGAAARQGIGASPEAFWGLCK